MLVELNTESIKNPANTHVFEKWLGPGDKDTLIAFKLIDTIRDTTQFNDFVEKTTQVDWIAFAKLLQETWFSRRWIVQEISLATGAELVSIISCEIP
jgi:hypothetical protein